MPGSEFEGPDPKANGVTWVKMLKFLKRQGAEAFPVGLRDRRGHLGADRRGIGLPAGTDDRGNESGKLGPVAEANDIRGDQLLAYGHILLA